MDMIAHTFDIVLECSIDKFDGESLDYNAPKITDEGTIVISPVDAKAAFISCALTDNIIPLDTTDGTVRTFNISLTMNAEVQSDNYEIATNIDDIGQLVISFVDSVNKFVSVTKNELNEIITEDNELDPAYSTEEVEKDLQQLTQNWTTTGSLRTNYESEFEDAIKILSSHYRTVEGDSISDTEWRVTFGMPIEAEVITEEVTDKDSVIDRFMRGELTIDTLNNVPENAVPLEELGMSKDKIEFYYDPDSDTVGYIVR